MPARSDMYSHLVARSSIPLIEAQVDAVVNAANNDLAEGAGVCGAIFSAAGVAELTAACRSLGSCATGQVQVTSAFKLAAKIIIHAVGPRGSDRPDLLASCYREALLVLTRRGLRSIAFPCISTGVYGFDFGKATEIALGTVKEWLEQSSNWSLVDRITFVMYSQAEDEVYASLWETYFPLPAAPVRAVTATAATRGQPTAASDIGTRRPSTNCGRGECASPPRELDIRPTAPTAPTARLRHTPLQVA